MARDVPSVLIPYYQARNNLTVCNDLLLFHERIVVPKALRTETLQRVHSGHQGVEWCRTRVAMSVWWTGVSRDVQEMVQNRRECAKPSVVRKEPNSYTSTGLSLAVGSSRTKIIPMGGRLFLTVP